jgi:hypothetical protein
LIFEGFSFLIVGKKLFNRVSPKKTLKLQKVASWFTERNWENFRLNSRKCRIGSKTKVQKYLLFLKAEMQLGMLV